MSGILAFRIAAVLGFCAVSLGAFGAHGLKATLEKHQTGAIWETAVLYHAIHALVLLFVASRANFQAGIWWSFFVGILIFSGSLYLLAFTNIRWLGAITPIGGVSFLVGWFWMALQAKQFVGP